MLSHAIGANLLGDKAIGMGVEASIVDSLNLILILVVEVGGESLGGRLGVTLSVVLNIGVGISCTLVAIVAVVSGGLDS